MIRFDVPAFYSGIHDLDQILEIGKRYYPEMRRWSLEDPKSRVLIDKQTKEILEVPKYHFALFIGGNPTVVPYDIISVIAMPRPHLRVPDLSDIAAREKFYNLYSVLSGRRASSRLVLEGTNNDQAYLEYSSMYDLSRVEDRRPKGVEIDSRIKLETGDTLFSFSYTYEVRLDHNYRGLGDVEYMPTSRAEKLSKTPAIDTMDLSTPVHRREWSQIWPKK